MNFYHIQDYIFGEICHGVLVIYADLLSKLVSMSSTAAPAPSTAGRSGRPMSMSVQQQQLQSALQNPVTYGQAMEEYEYFKVLYRQSIPSAMQAYWQPDALPSFPNVAASSSGGDDMTRRRYPSVEQLLQNSKILAVALQK